MQTFNIGNTFCAQRKYSDKTFAVATLNFKETEYPLYTLHREDDDGRWAQNVQYFREKLVLKSQLYCYI